jgi:hypothetical protein
MSALIAVSIGIGFLTAVAILLLVSGAYVFGQEEASFPQPQTEESGQ